MRKIKIIYRVVVSVLKLIAFFIFVSMPAGMGCPPFHRWNKRFKWEVSA
jgi:hypothetical protein